MVEICMNGHLVSENICNIVILQCPHVFTKESQTMLRLQLALVTLHGRFTINIKVIHQDPQRGTKPWI
jgi:hypothetical protein